MAAILLAAVLALLAWFVRNDRAQYRGFKALTRTEDRQRVFRRWTIRSFLLFCGTSLVVLLLLGRLDALLRPPPEFPALTPGLRLRDFGDLGTGFFIGVAGAVVASGLASAGIARWRRRRGSPARAPRILGDIEPLFPRNRAERKWTALLAANAGPGEELFFRLMLPLLIALVTGSVLFAFVAAGLIFGLVHFYQGWVGIVVTTILGFAFTALYLATGIIWIPVLLHSLLNLNTLWLRPLLAERRGGASDQSPSK